MRRFSGFFFVMLFACLFTQEASASCRWGCIAARTKAVTVTAVGRVRNVVDAIRPAPEVRLLPTVRRVRCDGLTCRSE